MFSFFLNSSKRHTNQLCKRLVVAPCTRLTSTWSKGSNRQNNNQNNLNNNYSHHQQQIENRKNIQKEKNEDYMRTSVSGNPRFINVRNAIDKTRNTKEIQRILDNPDNHSKCVFDRAI